MERLIKSWFVPYTDIGRKRRLKLEPIMVDIRHTPVSKLPRRGLRWRGARFNGSGCAFSVEGKRGLADLKRSDRSGYDGFAALSGRGRHRISYL
jgi:hypothetical protein